ncbi:MAG: hypothetical protein AAGA00_09140 [Pseudomonadota bacterium]
MAEDMQTYTPSDEERARQRKRSVVIAWSLVALVILFFVTTVVRMGSNIAMQAGG